MTWLVSRISGARRDGDGGRSVRRHVGLKYPLRHGFATSTIAASPAGPGPDPAARRVLPAFQPSRRGDAVQPTAPPSSAAAVEEQALVRAIGLQGAAQARRRLLVLISGPASCRSRLGRLIFFVNGPLLAQSVPRERTDIGCPGAVTRRPGSPFDRTGPAIFFPRSWPARAHSLRKLALDGVRRKIRGPVHRGRLVLLRRFFRHQRHPPDDPMPDLGLFCSGIPMGSSRVSLSAPGHVRRAARCSSISQPVLDPGMAARELGAHG